MFVRILASVLIALLLQTAIISFVLLFNGTLTNLENNAEGLLTKNAENRQRNLENSMVLNWSNLDKVENEIIGTIDNYFNNNPKAGTAGEAISQRACAEAIVTNASDALLNALRMNTTTGIFLYFAKANEVLNTNLEDEINLNGVYFRDLDPLSTPADYSDIQYLRGFSSIAAKYKIPLDNFWEEKFIFSPKSDYWETLYNPYITAINNPQLSSKNQSFWSNPVLVNYNRNDTYFCITYNRPLFYQNELIGVIGIEMQLNEMIKQFPSNDFSNFEKGGYILIKYDANSLKNNINCNILVISGSYLNNRYFKEQKSISLKYNKNTIYIVSVDNVSAHCSLHPLKLYNSNTPFADEQWALVSVIMDDALYASVATLQKGLVISALSSLFIGMIILAIVIRFTTKPLITLADQIAKSDPSDPVVITKSNIYEISLLAKTINAMKERRKYVESELREEREKYLIALESVADTFLEYNMIDDTLKLYHFVSGSQNASLATRLIEKVMEKVEKGLICHPDSIEELKRFISEENDGSLEIKIRRNLFANSNEEIYDWYSLKFSMIFDENEIISKIMIIAKIVNDKKEKELREYEASLRDITTKFYENNAGLLLINERIANLNAGQKYSLNLFTITNFNNFEAYYGRIFSAALLIKISKILRTFIYKDDICVRIDNNTFLVYNDQLNKNELIIIHKKIKESISKLYIGDNSELVLNIHFGTVITDLKDYQEAYNQADMAVQMAYKNQLDIVFYDDIDEETKNYENLSHFEPIKTFLEVNKENFITFVFDILEKTTDYKSVIQLILIFMGEIFDLKQILITKYDHDFEVNQVIYQFNASLIKPYNTNVEKIKPQYLNEVDKLFNINGLISFDDGSNYEIINPLLCYNSDENCNALACAMYENTIFIGMIIYKTQNKDRNFNEIERNNLFEVTKIIAAHLSIVKSTYASKAKSDFLSRMSHEIRTPMNAIIGMTNIAKESINNPIKLDDCLKKIDFSSHHLLALINDILDMSKIESGKLKISHLPFSLKTLIETVDTLIRPTIEGKKINFIINEKINNHNVIGDEYRLRQVLINFLSNASKFTEANGNITLTIIELENDGKNCYYKFSVKDNGIGISHEDQSNIFIAFEQGNSKSDKTHEGTGLGLAISSSIIIAMESKIELKSKLGEGSDFYFTLKLPLDNTIVKKVNVVEKVETPVSFKGKRVLLAEDNEINVEIAIFILNDSGLEVEVAINGEEAVEKFTKSSHGYYNVILMDIQMPIMDGLTATRKIRKCSHPDAKTIPIVAMTANAFDEDMKKSIDSGMNGHIAKPIDVDVLFKVLKKLF